MIAVKLFALPTGAALLRPIAVVAAVAAVCLIALNISDGQNGAVQTSSGETALEARLETVLASIDGVGEANVLINGGEGVLVVAKGGDDIEVRLEIIRAVKALLGVSADRIEVLTMGG